MIVYQVNNVWHVKVSGGYRNRDTVAAEVRKYREKPEAVAKWKDVTDNGCGYGVSYYTTFRAGDETFTIQSYTWHAAPKNTGRDHIPARLSFAPQTGAEEMDY